MHGSATDRPVTGVVNIPCHMTGTFCGEMAEVERIQRTSLTRESFVKSVRSLDTAVSN